jgi:hypothetical protein
MILNCERTIRRSFPMTILLNSCWICCRNYRMMKILKNCSVYYRKVKSCCCWVCYRKVKSCCCWACYR